MNELDYIQKIDELNDEITRLKEKILILSLSSNKKYILLDDDITSNVDGKVLHRIQAVRDFNNVKAGDLGGYIESEDNLSHDGYCWVYDNARVRNEAMIDGNAVIFDDTLVEKRAHVTDYARIAGNCVITDNAVIRGGTCMRDVYINGNALINCNADYLQLILDRVNFTFYKTKNNDIYFVEGFDYDSDYMYYFHYSNCRGDIQTYKNVKRLVYDYFKCGSMRKIRDFIYRYFKLREDDN